jgi:UDP-glucose 4-epimerase
MPYIVKVASKELDFLNVYGSDYNTVDGSGVRDYIHIEDLAEGHVCAINYISQKTQGFKENINLGTGKGVSVFELIDIFENVTGVNVAKKITKRRPGDIASCYADPSKAKNILKWTAKRSIEEMCLSSWNYYKDHIDENSK